MPQKQRMFPDFGPFSLDLADGVVRCAGQPVKLRPKALHIFRYFLDHPGALVTRDELKQAAWGDAFISDNSVDQVIAEIRRQLGNDGRALIENYHGRGWRLTVDVTARTESVEESTPPIIAPRTTAPDRAPRPRRNLALAAGFVALIGSIGTFKLLSRPSSRPFPRITAYRRITEDGRAKSGPLVTDGHFVYYRANGFLAYRVALAGGDAVALDLPFAAIPFDFTSHGGLLVVSLAGSMPMWMWQPNASGVARGPDLAAGGHGGISTDGSRIAFGNGNTLTIKDLNTGAVRNLHVAGQIEQPRWAPDSSRIRFTLWDTRKDVQTIWEVGSDGAGLHQVPLTGPDRQQVCCGVWSRDGRYFLFLDRRPGVEGGGLWIANGTGNDSREPERLLAAPLIFRSAVPSIDNSEVLVIGADVRGEAERFDLRSRQMVALPESLARATDIAYSPDGKRVAYCDGIARTLWTADSGGENRKQITSQPLEVYRPQWSPEGDRLAFMAKRPGRPWRIYLADLATGNVSEAQPGGESDQGVATWSPDGNILVFGDRQHQAPSGKMAIHTIDLRTGTTSTLPGSEGKWSPRWSPDGNTIVAQSSDYQSLYLYDCRTRVWSRLNTIPGTSDAIWSPDGRYIYGSRSQSEASVIYRIALTDRTPEKVVSVRLTDGAWTGVAPDGSPLFVKFIRNEDVYALSWTGK